MFEHRTEPLLSQGQFVRRMVLAVVICLGLLAGSLALGVGGFRETEHLSWLDATLESSMLLAGEGPLHAPVTVGGKAFASFYAVFSGVMFITTAATLLTPVLHRIMHRLHLDDEGG
ncbi:MAG: hypothetical protein U0637_03690 [Phycisphaerales bacterium]